MTNIINEMSPANLESFDLQRTTSLPSSTENFTQHNNSSHKQTVAPAEMLTDGQTVYNLYRGIICYCKDEVVRIWIDVTHMELCVSRLDSSFIVRYRLEDLILEENDNVTESYLPIISSSKVISDDVVDDGIRNNDVKTSLDNIETVELKFWARYLNLGNIGAVGHENFDKKFLLRCARQQIFACISSKIDPVDNLANQRGKLHVV